MVFIVVHYTLGFSSDINIVFVIIQEFFKISSFVYVVYFYLKHAVNFTEEDKGRKFVLVIKFLLLSFMLMLGIALFIWIILRICDVVKKDPCRDPFWLGYRSITLLLILTVVTAGVTVQQKVKKKTKERYGTANLSEFAAEYSEDSIDIKHFNSKAQYSGENSGDATKLNTDSYIRRLKALNKSL
jgi:hypothetical protein